jgi:phospholipase/lecithinase/hemolysin
MAFQWTRRVLTALAPAALLALAACGSGTIESQFVPSRVVAFGDGLMDMGNKGNRFTVNDGSLVWPNIVALDYGSNLVVSAAGGTDYATGNARVTQQPDAAGSTATPTIQQQVDTFLGANSAFTAGDLVIVEGGVSDLIAQMAAFRAGTITSDAMIANAKQAGADLAAQAKRIVAAGATHVVIAGTYDLGKTPWAASIGQQDLLSAASLAFNNAVLVNLVQNGNDMLYVDVALLFNLMVSSPPSYSLTDATTVACTSVDSGNSIGIGTGQVSSALCTNSTVVSTPSYTTLMWADPVYPTPISHSTLANYAFARIRDRW